MAEAWREKTYLKAFPLQCEGASRARDASEFAPAGGNAVPMVDRQDANMPISCAAGSGCAHHQIDDVIDVIVVDDGLNFHLRRRFVSVQMTHPGSRGVTLRCIVASLDHSQRDNVDPAERLFDGFEPSARTRLLISFI